MVEFSDDMLQEVTGGAKVNEGLVYDTMPEGYIAVWGGTLEALMAQLKRTPYKISHIKHDANEQLKRIGIYSCA